MSLMLYFLIPHLWNKWWGEPNLKPVGFQERFFEPSQCLFLKPPQDQSRPAGTSKFPANMVNISSCGRLCDYVIRANSYCYHFLSTIQIHTGINGLAFFNFLPPGVHAHSSPANFIILHRLLQRGDGTGGDTAHHQWKWGPGSDSSAYLHTNTRPLALRNSSKSVVGQNVFVFKRARPCESY